MADLACTLADVHAQLKIPTADTTDDAWITDAIGDVTDWMQDFVRRYLVPKAGLTFNVDTAYGAVIDVRRYGVRTLTSLGISQVNQPDTAGTYTAVTLANVVLRPPELDRDPGMPATQLVILSGGVPLADAINGAHVVADCGPAATPDRIARVAIDAVSTAYQSRKAGGSGVIGGEGQGSIDWSRYFSTGSAQLRTLERLRGVRGIG